MFQNNSLDTDTKRGLMDLCYQYMDRPMSDETYNECSALLFYTAWFEELLFNNKVQQSPKNDEKICMDIASKIDLTQFDFFGIYFCDRYFNNANTANTDEYFKNLRLKDSLIVPVKTALLRFKENKNRDADLLYAYIMIVYRFRNNMFHGVKGLNALHEYSEQFKIINHFMSLLLKEILRLNYKGYNCNNQ